MPRATWGPCMQPPRGAPLSCNRDLSQFACRCVACPSDGSRPWQFFVLQRHCNHGPEQEFTYPITTARDRDQNATVDLQLV
eukprot:5275999-Pyramimonas_sp.AAC.1